MILVDSSVWIAFFNGTDSWQADHLAAILHNEQVLIGDLIPSEVLQGFRHKKDFETGLRLMLLNHVVPLGGQPAAIEAALKYRQLRVLGVITRNTVDSLIASACIRNEWQLLHQDREFEPYCEHLGLKAIGRYD
ncbi:MAG: PIN domain-containing protein [Opitutales bacterium]